MLSIELIAAVVTAVGAAGGNQAGVQQQAAATGPLVRVTIGYYLNDKVQDASRRCQFFLLDGADILPPTRVSGPRYWYPKPPEGHDPHLLRIFLTCDDHVVLVYPQYPVLGGSATVVLTVFTKPSLLRGEQPNKYPMEGSLRSDQ